MLLLFFIIRAEPMMARGDYYCIRSSPFYGASGYADRRSDIRHVQQNRVFRYPDIAVKYMLYFPLYNETRLNYAAYISAHSRA